MDEIEQNNPARALFNKAKSAFALGEIYEANIVIRKAIEFEANEEFISLAKDIKREIGLNSLRKAQVLFDREQYHESLDEATKALDLLEESVEAEEIITHITLRIKKAKSNRRYIWIAAILFLVIIVSIVLVSYGSYSDENDAFKEAEAQMSIAAYQHFLVQYPKGKFAKRARESIKSIDEQDESLWDFAVNAPSKITLERYLFKMESLGGTHVSSAKLMIDSFDFDGALKENSLEAIKNYIAVHPNGNYLPTAKRLLITLVTPEERNELLVYFNTFYELYASGNHESLMGYFNSVTKRFMNKTDISKADLLLLFNKNQDGYSSENISIDSSNFIVAKELNGNYTIHFTIDANKKKNIDENSLKGKTKRLAKKFRGEKTTVSYYSNQRVELILTPDKKINSYTVRLLSSGKR